MSFITQAPGRTGLFCSSCNSILTEPNRVHYLKQCVITIPMDKQCRCHEKVTKNLQILNDLKPEIKFLEQKQTFLYTIN